MDRAQTPNRNMEHDNAIDALPGFRLGTYGNVDRERDRGTPSPPEQMASSAKLPLS